MKNGGAFGTQLWETPIGRVVDGFDTVVQKFYSEYGDMPPWGKGPEQPKIHGPDGFSYIQDNFPLLDHFLECHVVRKSPNNNSVENDADKDIHRELTNGMVGKDHSHQVRSPKHLHHHQSHKDIHHATRNRKEIHINDGGDHHDIKEENKEQPRVVTAAVGELHHAHTVHFNAAPNEEGLTKLSWELVATCLVLFLAVLMLWLRFALCSPKKIRAARQRKSK
jgi:hypothetical protein